MPLILRVLIWLIVVYRRWISGRGPLRNVRCSFAPEDSCSAFGLRAAQGASSARTALGLIARRIGRCRDACLLTDGRALSWMEVHDRSPSAIATEMHADGEGPAAILRMLRARQAVAIWRADRAGIQEVTRVIEELRDREARHGSPVSTALLSALPAIPPRVCSQPAIQQRARRRLIVFGVVALAALAVLGFQPWIGGLALGLTATAGTVSARSTFERGRRFELHRTWAQRR